MHSPAVVLEAGSISRQTVISLSRDLVVAGEAQRSAVALAGDVRVSGWIGEDLVVLDGDAHLTRTARVDGDVYVLGGSVVAELGARIGGRTVAHPDAAASWLVLLEGPALGLSPFSRAVVGAKLALSSAWLLVGIALAATFARPLSSTSDEIRDAPMRSFLIGLVAVLTVTLVVVLLTAFTSVVVGLPLLVLLILLALLLKLWGTVAVFQCVGEWLVRWLRPRSPLRRPDPITAILAGLLLLGVLKLLPWAGIVVWTAATLIGVGATLATKFGRREPWLEGR
ncbi:MAG TPA: polymer-forming cytoskeletal protein [Thermoanaerobaculia bacterium]|nr:polymer-forming cytoskeletal protein [Thermoanaerobaculia bacterium]